jgi:ABC-type polysaccharide/polyol phosphate export permease
MSSSLSLNAAIGDIREGARLAPLWWRLGIDQTLSRYRRTLLGPFWLAASTMATGFSLALIFGGVLGGDWRSMVPFILTGVMIWAIITGAIADGAQTFMAASGHMQVQQRPLSYHVFLQMHRVMINFAHQVVAYYIVMTALGFFRVPHWHVLLAIPMVLAIGFCLSFPLGMLSTRYRDVGHFIGIAMGALFMLTPVFWQRRQVSSELLWIVDYNPLTYMLEIMRQPFLGLPADMRYWAVSLLILLMSALLAIYSLMKYRNRVVFWL